MARRPPLPSLRLLRIDSNISLSLSDNRARFLCNTGAGTAHASKLGPCTRPDAGRCRGEVKAAMPATRLAASHGYAATGTLAILRGYEGDRQQNYEHHKAVGAD